MKRIALPAIFISVLLLSAACSPEVTALPDTPTPTAPLFVTATLPPTQTPRPSPTTEPPTPTVAVAPVEGQTISQLNVRSAPSAESDLLGTVQMAGKVQIVGKDPTSGWWLIIYPQSPTGTGWVTAQFVQASNTQNVPVVSGQPQAGGNSQDAATVPGAEAIPTVEAGNGATSPVAPTLSLASAFPDGDSAQSPAVNIVLSKTSVRSFNYSSDISFPEGDTEDWIQFRLEGKAGGQVMVSVLIDCSGSSMLNVELLQNGVNLQGWNDITCGHRSQLQLNLFVGSPYSLHLFPAQGNNPIGYIAYTVVVQLF